MTGPSPIVKTRLKGAMHARFRAEQEARGMSESQLLRLALSQFFEGLEQPAPCDKGAIITPRSLVVSDPEQAKLERKTVWMPAFLMSAASARAQDKGMSFSRWTSSLVQSHLMRVPVLTEPELLAVEASTRELAAIGRNINQIARALGQAYFQTERIRLDKLAELSAKVSAAREAIRALVRASRGSWRAE